MKVKINKAMRKIILLLVFISFANSYSQILPLTVSQAYTCNLTEFGSGYVYNFKPLVSDKDLYDKMYMSLYNQKKFGEGSRYFYDFYQSHYIDFQLSMEALFTSGEFAYENNEPTRAEIILKELLRIKNPNEKPLEKNWESDRFKVLKYQSIQLLAKIFLGRNDYVIALNYLNIIKNEYPVFVNDFPSCQQMGEYERDLMIVKCYEGMNKIDDALSILNKYLFPNMEKGMYISKLEAYANLLVKKYEKDTLKESLLQGLDNIYLSRGRFYLVFMGDIYDISELNYQTYWDFRHVLRNKDSVISELKSNLQNSILYKLIMER